MSEKIVMRRFKLPLAEKCFKCGIEFGANGKRYVGMYNEIYCWDCLQKHLAEHASDLE